MTWSFALVFVQAGLHVGTVADDLFLALILDGNGAVTDALIGAGGRAGRGCTHVSGALGNGVVVSWAALKVLGGAIGAAFGSCAGLDVWFSFCHGSSSGRISQKNGLYRWELAGAKEVAGEADVGLEFDPGEMMEITAR